MTETFVVLGTARSGTSVTAGLLNLLGVPMDAELGGADFFAPKGYFESAGANAINKKVYRRAWAGARDYPDDDVAYYWNPPEPEAVRRQADAVADDIRAFAARHDGDARWGFKNPATALTLELYLPHLENPRFVVVRRDLEENVAACALIYGLDAGHVRRVLTAYRDRLEDVLRSAGHPRLDIDYDELRRDHGEVARRLAVFCGAELTPARVAAIDAFVVKEQFGLDKYRAGGRAAPRGAGATTLPARINLGSGKAWHPDYLNVDLDPYWKPDILADLNLPFPPREGQVFETERFGAVRLGRECFDLIVANDVLEHVANLTVLMKSCLDLLRFDGKFEILVPYDLSYGAWQDPTHVRAFNERSWTYFTDWFWYLGWTEARFHLDSLRFNLSDLGQRLKAREVPTDEILRSPRAVDAMQVSLRKVPLGDADRQALEQVRRIGQR